MNTRRWGDNDHYFGPFTFAFRERWRHFAVVLSSADDDDRGANLRISAFGNTMIVAMPNWIIRPYRTKVYPGWDDVTVKRLGRDWYWDVDERVFGFTLCDGHLSVKLGRQTHDSSTTQDWGCFLPWTQWRHVRHSFYGLDGRHFWTESDEETRAVSRLGAESRSERYEIVRQWAERCPTMSFAFDDFDGERITATTKIDEREWRFGTGYFKWLSLFRRPKIRRSLDIHFSSETGGRKGSWKGGTIGHSIGMLPDELHEAAFRRYCSENKMTFVGASS